MTNTIMEWNALHRTDAKGRVVWGIGAHPGEEHSSHDIEGFIAAVDGAAVVGEVGLDFRPTVSASAAKQRRILDRILDQVEATKKMITLHSVRAAGEVIDSLRGRDLPGAILHWFLGSDSMIDRAIDMDVFFSVNQVMLNSRRGRAAVLGMPPNRILLETDAPYGVATQQTPVNLESALNEIVGTLARIWRVSKDEATSRILANQRAFLGRVTISWSA